MAKPKLTIALSHYDRHVPFFDGTAQPKGIDLQRLDRRAIRSTAGWRRSP